MNLADKYRPKALGDVLGQDKAVHVCMRLVSRGLGGRAVWISGPSGAGKTTLALILAHVLADDLAVEELDATDLTPGRLRELESGMHLSGFGKGGRAYIVNEAHGLRKDTIRQLLVLLERLPGHVCFIFTSTRTGTESLFEDDPSGDAGPLLSRCFPVYLTNQGLAKPFAEHAKAIAEREGLDGQPVARYVKLMQDCRNNLRMALNRIEAGEMLA